ncbi:MAG TPA: BatD family protein [Chitinophagaceae bacterium]
MLLVLGNAVSAQVQFDVSVNAREIGRRDEVEVRYLISGTDRASDFQPPYFSNWTVMSGPVISSTNYTLNGKSSASTSYTYLLSPMKAGKLVIPSTTIAVNGKTYTCKGVQVLVKNQAHVAGVPGASGGQQATVFSMNETGEDDYKEYLLKPGEDPLQKIRSNLLVRAVASKKKCYVGEPVLVTYKLYTRLRSNSRVVKQPGFTGCSVSEMTTNELKPESEVVNGKKYTSYLFRKVQLFPLQPGVITVGAASVDNTVTFISNTSDLRKLYYGLDAGEAFDLNLSTEPFTIEVMPLPGKKTAATVGNFEIFASLQKDTIAANETNALVVTVAGSGNFKSVKEPQINWPSEIYHFDATEKDELDKLSFPLSGRKIYEIPFEVNRTGVIRLAAVNLSFFDPVKGIYKTVSSKPLQLTVTPAVRSTIIAPVTDSVSDWDIRYLLFLLPLVFLVAAVVLWMRPRKPRVAVVATQQEPVAVKNPVAINYLDRINELRLLQDDTEFYSNASELSRQMLQYNQGNNDLLLQVIQDCNTILYTPIASTSRKEILEKLERALV